LHLILYRTKGRYWQAVNKIYVIGIGFRPLEKRAKDIVLQSEAVLANSRLLDVFKEYDEYESVKDKIIVHGSVYETLDYIGDNYKQQKITLLAAGDPMFFGIGRLVIERFGKDDVEVFPDLSSLQVAFSKIRETSSGAYCVSFHGGPDPTKRRKLEYELKDIPALLGQYRKIGILTDKVNNPAVIAGEVLKLSGVSCQPASLKIYVCEKLGYPDEKIIEGAPQEIAEMSFVHPNVVVIVRKTNGNQGPEVRNQESEIILGLKESEIAHSKGLITKDEVRAVTLHKLRLTRRGVFWDIGAGSGSVSIEAAVVCPELKVIAIEKNRDRTGNINDNRVKFNTENVEIVMGEAPEILKDLPAPDRVFIGGSGGNIDAIINFVTERMNSGILVINAVTIDTLNEAVKSLEKNKFKIEISEVSISRSKMINRKRHMSALNPIFIVTGEKV
jgi:precorrin-6Y C5,15-methyltransferase (decarboxylating)